MNKTTFSKKFNLLFKFSNLTFDQLAERTGLSHTALVLYSQGKRLPRKESLNKIKEYFNVSDNYFESEFEYSSDSMIEYIEKTQFIPHDKVRGLFPINDMIEYSIENNYSLAPFVEKEFNDLLFMYRATKYINEKEIVDKKLDKECEDHLQDPKYGAHRPLNFYHIHDINRLFDLLGNISVYGLKAMLQTGERILEEERKERQNQELDLLTQCKIVAYIDKCLNWSLDPEESGDGKEIRINDYKLYDIIKKALNIEVKASQEEVIKHEDNIRKLIKLLEIELKNGNLTDYEKLDLTEE